MDPAGVRVAPLNIPDRNHVSGAGSSGCGDLGRGGKGSGSEPPPVMSWRLIRGKVCGERLLSTVHTAAPVSVVLHRRWDVI